MQAAQEVASELEIQKLLPSDLVFPRVPARRQTLTRAKPLLEPATEAATPDNGQITDSGTPSQDEIEIEHPGSGMEQFGLALNLVGTERLTCPAHVFQRVRATTGYHGGMIVGELEQTIGADIGLIDPVVTLSNEFFADDCTAQTLLRTSAGLLRSHLGFASFPHQSFH